MDGAGAVLEPGGVGLGDVDGGQQAERERQYEGDEHAGREHPHVHRGTAEEARLRTRERLDRAQAGCPEQNAQRPGRGREHGRLEHQSAHVLQPAGSERAADRQLAMTSGSEREHHVRHVGARGRHDERGNQRHDADDRDDVPAELFEQGPDDRAGLCVRLGIALPQIGGDRRQLRRCLVDGGAGLQPSEHEEATVVARRPRGVERRRHEEVHVGEDAAVDSGREDAGHRVRCAIKDQRAADHADPRVEVLAPEAVAQEDDGGRAGPALLAAKQPSRCGMKPERRGQVGGGANDTHALGHAVLAHRGRVVAKRNELVDGS